VRETTLPNRFVIGLATAQASQAFVCAVVKTFQFLVSNENAVLTACWSGVSGFGGKVKAFNICCPRFQLLTFELFFSRPEILLAGNSSPIKAILSRPCSGLV
jgi:hypothetical protein